MSTAPGSRPVRSRQPREKRVADIMRAAREIFGEKGYDAASMSEIAARAGLAEASLYRFFDTKRDLLVTVVEDWYEEMLEDYDRHLAGVHGVWNRLRYMIWRHLKSIEENPDLSRLVFLHIRIGAGYLGSSVYQLNKRYTQHTMDILREGIASGELRDDMPLTMVRDLIYGCAEHHTWRYIWGLGGLDADRAADQIATLVYRSVAAAPPDAGGTDRLERIAARLEESVARLEGIKP